MKKIMFPILAICLVLSTENSFAQQKKKPISRPKNPVAEKAQEKKLEKTKMSEEEMQKAWMSYATPNDVHKMLEGFNGTWTGQVLQWMAPGQEAMKSESKCINKMIMGGRYQQSEHFGNMMGMPFEGMSLLAYDNAKKVFVSTWIDNMGTGIMFMEGKWNKETNTIHFKGKMVDPTTGEDVLVREVFKLVDENTQIMEMYAPSPDGKGEFKTMEITFKRS